MAATIDATVGGASANSFVTAAEFSAYMETRLNDSAYTSATTDERTRALIEATRDLSARPWQGYRVDDTQALSWPRQWAHNPDDPYQDYYDTTVIPDRVKRATYELALAFLKAGTTDIVSQDEDLEVQSKEIAGAIRTEYVAPSHRLRGLNRYPAVTREISMLLAGGGSGFQVRTVRG